MINPKVKEDGGTYWVVVNGNDLSGGFSTFSTEEYAKRYAEAVRRGGDYKKLRRCFWNLERWSLGKPGLLYV